MDRMLLHRNLVDVAIALNLQYLAISVINVFVPLLLLERGLWAMGYGLWAMGRLPVLPCLRGLQACRGPG
jgi:hypothetical protein